MIPEIRDKYNREFTAEKYQRFLSEIWKTTEGSVDFRICETPLFSDRELTNLLTSASSEIISFLKSPDFAGLNKNAVPANLIVPNEDSHPLFLQIDFAVCKDSGGNLIPQLIELQGFPSLYAFQCELDRVNREVYSIPEDMTSYFSGLDSGSYLEIFRRAVTGNHAPENVVLLEINPHQQKTRIDFYLTRKFVGTEIICVTEVIRKGKDLFYKKDGREIRIERIYNRVIFDELMRKDLNLKFDFRDELNVEWAGHPNWFFKISKHTLPLIKSRFAPECFYLHEMRQYPDDLENYVLKPLYSFAGAGVIVELNKKILDSITDRENYILQRKVKYAPLIKTPDSFSKAEIRMMFIWEDEPILVNNLLRTSKGKMMGVDFNKGLDWVGSNIVYHF